MQATIHQLGCMIVLVAYQGRIVYTGEHLVEAQSRASINKSYVKMDNARVTAGETPRLLINLVDEFGNSINNTQYVHHGVSLLYLLPNNTSIRQQVGLQAVIDHIANAKGHMVRAFSKPMSCTLTNCVCIISATITPSPLPRVWRGIKGGRRTCTAC